MPRFASLVLFLVLASLTGCNSPGRWLRGKWVVDLDYTREQMKLSEAEPAAQPEGLSGMLQNMAQNFAAPLVMQTLAKVEITFTDEEIVSTIDGNGKATGYEIVETPDRNTVIVKKADGEVQTFVREGDRIRTTMSGAVPLTVFLKRAE